MDDKKEYTYAELIARIQWFYMALHEARIGNVEEPINQDFDILIDLYYESFKSFLVHTKADL